MSNTKIHFTKKQYWDLMRAMYIADYISNAVCLGDKGIDTGIRKLQQHVYTFAKEYGYSEYVDSDEVIDGHYRPSSHMEDDDTVVKLLERYNDDTFYSTLIDNLSTRDYLAKFSTQEISKMSVEEHFREIIAFEHKWSEEFEKNGIDRLQIK